MKPDCNTKSQVFDTWLLVDNLCYLCIFIYRSNAKREAPTTVKTPDATRERELIAPSIDPISIALVVPIAWAALPQAIPLATGSLIPNNLQIGSAKILPKIPVAMMAATVMDT